MSALAADPSRPTALPLMPLFARTEHPHTLRNLIDRQASIRMIGYYSRKGHGGRCCFFRILHKRRPAALRDCPQPSGPVAITATQDDPHDAPPMGFGSGNEQGIRGGTGMVNFRPLIQPDASVPQKHMIVGGCHVDVPGFDQCAILSKCRRVLSAKIEQTRENA